MLINLNQKIVALALLFLVSNLVFSVQIMSIYAPLPFYFVILGWIIPGVGSLLTPVLFGLSVWVSGEMKKPHFLLLGEFVVLLGLSVLWFTLSWKFGIQYQGFEHTVGVLIENIIGMSVLGYLLWSAFRTKNNNTIFWYQFVFFFMLSWCAFPYLGELP